MKRVHLYLLKEMTPPFFFGMAIFTTLLLSAGVLFSLGRIALEVHPPLSVLLYLFFLSLPRWVIYALPLSVLLAGLLSLGRLSQDQELLALKALGIPLTELLFPLLLFGGTVMLFLFFIQETVVPSTQLQFDRKVAEITHGKWGKKEDLILQLKQDKQMAFYLYARSFDFQKRAMQNVFFVYFKDGQPLQFVRAREGRYSKARWEFLDGYMSQMDKRGQLKRQGSFRKQAFVLPVQAEKMEDSTINPSNMNAQQLKRYFSLLTSLGESLRSLKVDYYWHFSIPLAAPIFALFCLPLSLLLHRQSHALGLGLSAFVTFCYYVFMNVGNVLGKAGKISPALAAFFPNLFFLSLALLFLRKANR